MRAAEKLTQREWSLLAVGAATGAVFMVCLRRHRRAGESMRAGSWVPRVHPSCMTHASPSQSDDVHIHPGSRQHPSLASLGQVTACMAVLQGLAAILARQNTCGVPRGPCPLPRSRRST
jgi:hypothetical protein